MAIIHKLNYYVLSDFSPVLAAKLSYFSRFKKPLNLKNPKTLNEKINYLKLVEYKDNETISNLADKYLVREYISEKYPDTLVELYGVWDDFQEVDWSSLPEKFVMKMNHGAGYNFVCEDKSKYNPEDVSELFGKWKSHDFWKIATELQYKGIQKKIIAEEFIETESGNLPNDYKIYCFHGEPMYIMSCGDRESGNTKFYYFDTDGVLIPFSEDSKNAIKNNIKVELPDNYQKMLDIAKDLSAPFKFVRVDLYSEFDKIYFGELTFSPGAGLDGDRLIEVDEYLGDLLEIDI